MPSMRTAAIDAATRLGPVHLTVADLDASITFYRDVIGLELLASTGAAAALGAGAAPMLVLTGLPGARPQPRRATGLYHVALLMPTRRDLARSLRRLVDTHYPLQGASDHLVSEALYLADPDGHGLELYADRPRAAWPVQDRQVTMATDALDLRGLLGELGPDTVTGPFAVDAATTVGHIHLRVADLGDAERFYHGGLGFDVTQRSYPGALFLSAGGYHHHIGANIWGSGGGSPAPEGTVGLRHYTILAPDSDALHAVLDRTTESGFAPKAHGAAWWVRDQSGIITVLAAGSPDAESELAATAITA